MSRFSSNNAGNQPGENSMNYHGSGNMDGSGHQNNYSGDNDGNQNSNQFNEGRGGSGFQERSNVGGSSQNDMG